MNRDLLFSVTKKDFQIQYFSGTGAGGQHRNKHQNCVRLRHPDSGADSTGQSHKNREANRKEAFLSLINSAKFKLWHQRRICEIQEGKTIEEIVGEMMSPENLKTENLKNGVWENE